MEEKLAKEKVASMMNDATEFTEASTLPMWGNYYAVSKYKSVRRAIRRGHVDLYTGAVYPRRPFNNRKATRGRKMNELRKTIYGQLKSRASGV